MPPKTRARGSARRQIRHKARVEPLARRLGQYAAIAALNQVVCPKRRGPLSANPAGTEAGGLERSLSVTGNFGAGSGSGALMKGSRFAADSMLEEAGLELLVPVTRDRLDRKLRGLPPIDPLPVPPMEVTKN